MDFLLYLCVILSLHIYSPLIVLIGDENQEGTEITTSEQVEHMSKSGNITKEKKRNHYHYYISENNEVQVQNHSMLPQNINKKRNSIGHDNSIHYQKNYVLQKAAFQIKKIAIQNKTSKATTSDSAKEDRSLKPSKLYGEYDYVVRVYDKSIPSHSVKILEEYLLSKAELSSLSELQTYTLSSALSLNNMPNFEYFHVHGLMLSQGNEPSKVWRELECYSRDGHPVFYVINKSYPVRIHECGSYGESKFIISSEIEWQVFIGDDGNMKRMYYIILNAPYTCKKLERYKISFVANNYSFVQHLTDFGYDPQRKQQSFAAMDLPTASMQLSLYKRFLHVYKVGGVKKHFYSTCIVKLQDIGEQTFTVHEESLEVWNSRPMEEGDEYCYIITKILEPPAYNDPDKKYLEYEVVDSNCSNYGNRSKFQYDTLQPRKKSKRV